MADLTRRGFLGLLAAGTARLVLPYEPKTIYSFPSEIVVPEFQAFQSFGSGYGAFAVIPKEMWDDRDPVYYMLSSVRPLVDRGSGNANVSFEKYTRLSLVGWAGLDEHPQADR